MSLDKKREANLKAYERLTRTQEKEVLRVYKGSLDTIRAEIALGFEKYGSDFGEWQKYNRLTNLENSINVEIAKLSRKGGAEIKKGAALSFSESYYRTGFMLETEVGVKLGFGILNPKAIARAIENPLDRVGFLARNKDNSARLARQLNEHLTKGLIQGKGYSSVARDIKNRMDIGGKDALRITRTEMHRTWEQGHKDGIEEAQEAGLKLELIWDATLDDKTRPSHQALDGQVADENNQWDLGGITVDGPGMTGDPAEDINCRCGIREQIKGYEPKVRMARENAEEQGKLIEHKTYKEWAESRIPGAQIVETRESPWLYDKKAGKEVLAKYEKVSIDDVKGLKKQGWDFDWEKPINEGYDVFALKSESDNKIQGLISYKPDAKESFIHIGNVESAPSNRGTGQVYSRTAPRLGAMVCKESFDMGFDGYVNFEAKTNLVEYYSRVWGAVQQNASQGMIIDSRGAAALIKEYLLIDI